MRVRHKHMFYLGMILFLLGLAMSTGMISLTVMRGPINIVVGPDTYRQYYRLSAEALVINTSLARPTGSPYMGLITIYMDGGEKTINIYFAGNGTVYVLGKGPKAYRPSWLAGVYMLSTARLGSTITIYSNHTMLVDGREIPVYGGRITGLFVDLKAPVPPITGKIIITGNGYLVEATHVSATHSTADHTGTSIPRPPSQAVADKSLEASKAGLSMYMITGGVILVLVALLL